MYLADVIGPDSLLTDKKDCDGIGRSEINILALFDVHEADGSIKPLTIDESWSPFEILLFLVELVEPKERFCLERPLSS